MEMATTAVPSRQEKRHLERKESGGQEGRDTSAKDSHPPGEGDGGHGEGRGCIV